MLTQSPQDSKGQRHSSTRTAAKPCRAGVPARLRAGRLAGGRTRDLEPGSPVKLMGSGMRIDLLREMQPLDLIMPVPISASHSVFSAPPHPDHPMSHGL
jgi:hypothetical protein